MTDTTPIRFRRHGQVTLLRVVERPETWTTRSGKLMTVAIGDRVIMDLDGGIRSVKPDSFNATHVPVEGNAYERTGEVWARPAQPGERVLTQEGEDIAGEDQWLVTDDDGHSWFVPENVFELGYRPAFTADQEAAENSAQKWAEETLETFGITPEDTAADLAAGREEAAITALLDNKHLRTCIALGATPTDLAAEWTRYHPGITAKEVDAIIEAGEIDPRTATR